MPSKQIVPVVKPLSAAVATSFSMKIDAAVSLLGSSIQNLVDCETTVAQAMETVYEALKGAAQAGSDVYRPVEVYLYIRAKEYDLLFNLYSPRKDRPSEVGRTYGAARTIACRVRKAFGIVSPNAGRKLGKPDAKVAVKADVTSKDDFTPAMARFLTEADSALSPSDWKVFQALASKVAKYYASKVSG